MTYQPIGVIAQVGLAKKQIMHFLFDIFQQKHNLLIVSPNTLQVLPQLKMSDALSVIQQQAATYFHIRHLNLDLV